MQGNQQEKPTTITNGQSTKNLTAKAVSDLESVTRLIDDRISVLFAKSETLNIIADRLTGPVPQNPTKTSIEAVPNGRLNDLRYQAKRLDDLLENLRAVTDRFDSAI